MTILFLIAVRFAKAWFLYASYMELTRHFNIPVFSYFHIVLIVFFVSLINTFFTKTTEVKAQVEIEKGLRMAIIFAGVAAAGLFYVIILAVSRLAM